MNTTVNIRSTKTFHYYEFFKFLDVPHITLDCQFKTIDECMHWQFHCVNKSTTLFQLSYDNKGTYQISIDNLAAYDDLKLFPYLVDSLVKFLDGQTDIENIYRKFNEEWRETTIADEIAMLKGTLSLYPFYFLVHPLEDFTYVTLDLLLSCGVNLHSSTPRIYGYVQFLLRHKLLPHFDDYSQLPEYDDGEEVETDIPQHVPIGRVKSWQLDGSETYETYSQEDVNHLMFIANFHRKGKKVLGVVLNDIGTLHQEGIGMPVDGEAAVYWFTEAYEAGDTLYAPTNLGDLYRKGCGTIKPNLQKAFEAYSLSTDPYAHYRLGQAYEEGWTGKPDMKQAMKWYEQAAKEGHHLAIKRLG
ncbi:MAG: sel1 repeat family protein [Bacteroides sp.]|nr:sel1 repeat family protein [Bacteroides sp.]